MKPELCPPCTEKFQNVNERVYVKKHFTDEYFKKLAERDAQIKAGYASGKKMKELGIEYNLTTQRIFQIVKE